MEILFSGSLFQIALVVCEKALLVLDAVLVHAVEVCQNWLESV